jgi:hypothetical protein
LSTDDPPVLTALAAGTVTITAGTATADVTVSVGALPLGTVLWSNPGNGSGVYSIVPAVPSPNGVADVFAFQYDGTVQAITSDGATAWTADLSQAAIVLPDFRGGLVATEPYSGGGSIVVLDGATGQPSATYAFQIDDSTWFWEQYLLRVHPDGTIFTVLRKCDGANMQYFVVGIDPTSGAEKFRVATPLSGPGQRAYGLIVAGDGYAYKSTRWRCFA